MDVRLSHEELEVLNDIIIFINPDEEFTIGSLHANHILKKKYPNGKGGVDLVKYDEARKDFKNRSVYRNLNRYMLQQGFVKPLEISNDEHKLQLTAKGEILWAYENLEKYFNSFRYKTEYVDEVDINRLIQAAPPYGEFTTQDASAISTIEVIDFNILDSDESVIHQITQKLDPKSIIIKDHEVWLKDQSILEYLVNNGFAINRHDINDEHNFYRQLTDKGRKLKELGAIKAYDDYIQKKEVDNKRRKQREDRLYWINFWIAAGAIAAMIYYFVDLIVRFWTISYRPSITLVSFQCIIFLFGIISGGIIYMILMELLRKRLK